MACGFVPEIDDPIDLPPYHYGWIMKRRLRD